MKVLLLDADRAIARAIESELNGARLHAAHGQAEGLRMLRDGGWDLILLDAGFSGAGMEILRRLRTDVSTPPVVLLTSEEELPLLELSDALRTFDTPSAITSLATARLGERLDASRVFYAEIAGGRVVLEPYDVMNAAAVKKPSSSSMAARVRNGRSTRSFIDEGRWRAVVATT